ncbi:MAG TPA: hypothetical protein VLV16_15750 [Gemmatimonadales bacterium]|nr:hypothetical protein [Gemmatimonadales bacterium]
MASHNRLSAQVGYPPDHSPYSDVARGVNAILSAGYLTGDRGEVPVGPSDGPMITLRFERPLSRVMAITLETSYAQTTRYLVDPADSAKYRYSQLVDEPLFLLDVGLMLRLTGAKAWHHFAPYFGMTGGAAISVSPPPDPSGYEFKARPMFGPSLGLRWYWTSGFSVRIDTRVRFWQVKYPLTFKQLSPDGTRILDLDADDTDWTTHPGVTVGLGWTF